MKRSLNEILFAVYTSLVFSLVYTADFSLGFPYLILLFAVFFILFYFLSRPVFSLIGKINPVKAEIGDKKIKFFVLGAFLVSLLYLGAWYCYYYPGWFSGDSLAQMAEATSGNYTDWHPALHTFLTFAIPLKLTGGWQGSIVLFQIVEFSAALAYMVKTFIKRGNVSFAVIAFAVILFNPVTGAILKQPWKDVALAICAMLLGSYAINIFFDKLWITRPLNIIALSLITVIGTIVRHNAVLFTLPLAVAIIHFTNNKLYKILFPVSALVLFALIKGPFYSYLGVTDPGNRVTETVGLPMVIIGEAVKESPDTLDQEVLDFAYSIAPADVWDEYYTSGDFNNIKFNGNIDTSPIENAGYAGVAKILLLCFKGAPKYALKGLIDGTKMVYAISGNIHWNPEFIPPKLLNPILSSPFKYVVLYVGLGNLLAVSVSLQGKNGWLSLPLLIHNFGTMLLLTGPDFRFFYLTYPYVWIILFHIFFIDKKLKI